MLSQPFNEQNILIRKLEQDEIISIYTSHSVRHFPACERKPVSAILRLCESGSYTGYGLYPKQGTGDSLPAPLLCYAFFAIVPGRKNILLDYFAVMEEYRSHGIGSLFLRYVKSTAAEYDGILIEIENPDFAADADELSIRSKRFDFYKRNGAFYTGILAEIFEARYKLLYFPVSDTPPVETIYADFDEIYQHMVSPEHYRTQVHISLGKNKL